MGLFILSQILDGIFTTYLIDTGFGYEANPFMAMMMARIGLYGGLILTKGIGCVIGLILYSWSPYSRVSRLGLIYTTIAMLLLDTYSVSLIYRVG